MRKYPEGNVDKSGMLEETFSMSSSPNQTDKLSKEFLERVAKSARRKAFKKGLPVAIYENGSVVLEYKDGRKEIVKKTKQNPA